MIKVKIYTKSKAAAGTSTGPGSGSVYANTQSSGRASYADKAGRAAIADKAEYADKAGIAEDVNIEAEVFQHFLRSDEEDTAEKRITFAEGLSSEAASTFKELLTLLGGLVLGDGKQGITSDGIATLKEIVSQAFSAGASGSGFRLGNYGSTKDSYLEVDRLLVRKAAEFVKLVIRELQSVGGEIVLSPAAMKISKVDFLKKGTLLPEYGTYPLRYDVYSCSFLTKRGDEEITNPFVVNDLVRCQTFNIKEGTTANAKNRYYWRRVTAVGSDFIDILALSGGSYGDSQPQAGDELVQMGNTTDTARQSVILLSAYGADSPSLKMYYGVDDYSLADKEVFVLSRSEMYALAEKFKFVTGSGKEMSFAQLVMDVDGLRTTVANNKTDVDGQIEQVNSQITQQAGKITTLTNEQTAMGKKMSKIEQSTDKISLQVETTTNLKNCIVGSALRPWDDNVKIKASLSQKVEITSGGGVGGSNYATFSASGATANTYTGMYFQDVRVTPSKTYVFSVWTKLVTLMDSGSYYAIKRYDGGTEGTVVKTATLSIDLNGWKLNTTTFTVPDGCTNLLLEIAVRKNGAIGMCRPMIMEGTEYGGWSLSPYDKTEAGNLESGLKRAGIDLENGKIKATADTFEIQNNSGVVTASVNEKGLLEVYAGLFSGFVRKKLTIITPENIGQYTIPSAQLGYVVFDFAVAGSFVSFEGDFAAVYGGSYPVIVLPYCNYSSDTKQHSVLFTEALPYLDQKFIVINNTNTSIVLVGGGTINKKGSTINVDNDLPNEVGMNMKAIVTCTLKTTIKSTGNTCTIVWDGYVYG